MNFTLLLNLKQFISAIKLYIIYKWKVYISSCGTSTNIVQSVHQKCLEWHNFVPIFLKFFWGRTPRPPVTCIV